MKRAVISVQESGRKRRRPSAAVVVSAAVHTVVILLLAHVLAIPTNIGRFFESSPREATRERVGFVAMPRVAGEAAEPGVDGGDGRPLVRPREVPRLIAPAEVPLGIPPAPPVAERTDPEAGSGPLLGRGGPRQGVRPAYRDPRLWREPSPVQRAPRTVQETIDDIIATDVARLNDSIAAAQPGRDPGDWTFERNGRKYGIDSKYIRLGPVSIPTAVLALLPINVQANPTALDRERALSYMHRDIQYHAQRAISEDEFRRNVRNLRERKERERAATAAAAAAATGGGSRSSSPVGEKETERQDPAPAAPSNPQGSN